MTKIHWLVNAVLIHSRVVDFDMIRICHARDECELVDTHTHTPMQELAREPVDIRTCHYRTSNAANNTVSRLCVSCDPRGQGRYVPVCPS